jgi:phosphoglycolate phosphatase-like HAD superfamily hydrolase
MLPLFFSRGELDRFRSDLEKYRGELFKREYLPKLNAFPRVRELFERIKYNGRKIALGSSAKAEEVNIYNEIARIADLVDCVACSEEVQQSKPHRDICATALNKLGDVLPEYVLAIGDTVYDIEAAAKVNVRSIALLCGGGNREELQQAGSIAIYRHPADLLEHYDDSPLGSALISDAAAGRISFPTRRTLSDNGSKPTIETNQQENVPVFPDAWVFLAAYYIWKAEGEQIDRDKHYWEKAKTYLADLWRQGKLPNP